MNLIRHFLISIGMDYGLIILAWILFGSLHSLTATARAKAWAWTYLGIAPRFYRLFYNALSFISFIPVLLALAKARVDYLGDWQGSTVMGVGVMGVGALVGGLAFLNYDLAEFAGWPPAAGRAVSFQQRGLLRWVRHPLYSALLLMLMGWICQHPDYKHLLFGLAAGLYIRIGIYFEERKLVCQFKEVYERYRQKTPMLVPDFFQKK